MPSSSFRFDHVFTPKLEFSIWVKSFDLKKKEKTLLMCLDVA